MDKATLEKVIPPVERAHRALRDAVGFLPENAPDTPGNRASLEGFFGNAMKELAIALESATAAGPCERFRKDAAGKVIMMRCADRAREREKRAPRKAGMDRWDLAGWGFCDSCTAWVYACLAAASIRRVVMFKAVEAEDAAFEAALRKECPGGCGDPECTAEDPPSKPLELGDGPGEVDGAEIAERRAALREYNEAKGRAPSERFLGH